MSTLFYCVQSVVLMYLISKATPMIAYKGHQTFYIN